MPTHVRSALAWLFVASVTAACASSRSASRDLQSPPRPGLITQVPATPSPPVAVAASPAPATGPLSPSGSDQGPTTPAPGPQPTTPPAPPGKRPNGPPRPGRQIVLNFDNADIEAVIQAASEIQGFNFTLAPGVAGKKVTVQTSGRIPEDEVFNVLLAVLEVNGVTAIRSGNLYKIVPIAAARERPVPTIIGAQPDPTRRDDEVITQIIPVTHGPAERIAAAVRPFVQGGNVVVQGSLLILTDTAANITRLLQIVGVLDVEVSGDELRFIAVRYADAVELAKTLTDFFNGRRARTSAPPVVAIPTPGAAAPRAGAAAPGAPGILGDSGERPPLILADKRTNSLVVSARRSDLEIATKLIGQLDVDTQANKRVFVYYVENVKAKEIAVTLTDVFGRPGQETTGRPPGAAPSLPTPYGAPPTPIAPAAPAPFTPLPAGGDLEPGVVEGQVKVIADEPNNALVITTFPRNWPLIEDTIRKLDRTPKQVLIEVLVAELSLTDENRMGIEWALRSQKDITIGGNKYNVGGVSRLDVGTGGSGQPAGLTNPTIPTGASGIPVLVPPVAGLSFFIFETDRFLGLLNLYGNYGQLSVLSSPSVLTSENKKATINVSQSIPIVTQQVVSQTGTVATQVQQSPSNVLTQSVEYKDAGIVLTVTPRISDKRVVSLDVKQTVNDVGAQRPPSGSPDIIKRELETSVVLRDNQTLVLGGLIRTKRTSGQTGIPYLSKIPILGFLFGVTADTVERTELLLVITPRVIGDPSEGQELYQQLRLQRPELERGLRGAPSILKPQEALVPADVLPPSKPTAPTSPPPGGSANER